MLMNFMVAKVEGIKNGSMEQQGTNRLEGEKVE